MADGLAERDVPVFVHMDGDLKPLWQDIAGSRVGGLDSFSPAPDNDTTVAEAVSMWPDNVPDDIEMISHRLSRLGWILDHMEPLERRVPRFCYA